MSDATDHSADDKAPYVLYSNGQTLVFDSIEEMREWAHRPKTDEEYERGQQAMEMIRELHAMILERTGGKGIAEEDFQDAMRAMKDH